MSSYAMAGTGRLPQVARIVRDCLDRCPYRSVQELVCEVCDGIVTLRGTLPSYYLKQMAQEAISQLPGVVGVVNEAQVVD